MAQSFCDWVIRLNDGDPSSSKDVVEAKTPGQALQMCDFPCHR